MSETKLLPCPNPWCGASTPTVLSPDTFADTWCVECHACKVRALECDTEKLAIAAWNTRTPDPRIAAAQGMADALKDAVRWLDAIESRIGNGELVNMMPNNCIGRTQARESLAAWEKLQ